MLIAIAGPSTVGKDSTWLRVAASLGFSREIPYTTRAKRSDEIHDREYHFLNADKFQEMIRNNQFTDWDYTLGAYYGTGSSLKDRIDNAEDVVLQVLARMAIRLKKQLTDVRTVLLQVSDQMTLSDRLDRRGYSGRELAIRIAHGSEEGIHAPLFDFLVPDADIMTDADVKRILLEIISSR